jgi:hypothetical protein
MPKNGMNTVGKPNDKSKNKSPARLRRAGLKAKTKAQRGCAAQG